MLRKVISKFLGLTLSLLIISMPVTVNAKTTYDVPNNSDFKSFMDYRTITSTNSKQYQLQQKCVTTNNGLRIYNGRYTVAIGTGFDAKVGTYIDVHLSTGEVLQCIVGDIKKNVDTDATNMQVAHNGNIVEFIVDANELPKSVKSKGSISAIDEFSGYVDTITKYSDEDTTSIDWQPVVTDVEETNKFLVTNKYTIDVADNTLYVVEYTSSNDCNTVEVSEEEYKRLIVNKSFVELP